MAEAWLEQMEPQRQRPAAFALTRLKLSNFRNYGHLELGLEPRPVVLVGENGAGKTNLLEAISLLTPGRGLRGAPYHELARAGGDGGWAIWAELASPLGQVTIGTGQRPTAAIQPAGERSLRREVRIDGAPARGSGALAAHLDVVWLTPAMDGLFTGPASERRRFLDRLVLCLDTNHRSRLNRFERAMRQRNRLLEDDGGGASTLLDALEQQMAESAVAIAAARLEALERIRASVLARRERAPESPFPWLTLMLEGQIEGWLGEMPALDAEDRYRALLRNERARDRAAGRTLSGPHRSDLVVHHGPKGVPARLSSTGEQKALLINLVLAQAELARRARNGVAPILLLDEIAAHLDKRRRAALFEEVVGLGAQAWMTGTEARAFAPLEGLAHHLRLAAGADGAPQLAGDVS